MADALNILVVDDESTNLEIAEVILSSLGHRVTTCLDGAEALALCLERSERYDLILMDVLMPVMDGLEATRRLRAHPDTRDVPIICLSAKASGSDQTAGLQAGCNLYLTKPYRRADLLHALETTLG